MEQTWSTDGAQHRAAAVAALLVGLGPDDEPFLEGCLDDRARSVREEACRLLDRLPGSARAARMADRLRPLLTTHGTLRKHLEIGLPDDPDDAAVRDGLVDPGPGVSKRARWLQQIVAGAPLEVWTEVTRAEPAKVVAMLRPDDALVVTGALTAAAAGRHDLTWARALMRTSPDTRLLALLPADERERHLLARVSAAQLGTLSTELAQAPRPWGPDLSRAVLAAVGSDKTTGHAVRALRDVLPTALHPSTLPAVEKAMHAAGDDTFLRTTLRDVLQFQSLNDRSVRPSDDRHHSRPRAARPRRAAVRRRAGRAGRAPTTGRARRSWRLSPVGGRRPTCSAATLADGTVDHAEVRRPAPAHRGRRRHAGHRPGAAAARRARHRQDLGVASTSPPPISGDSTLLVQGTAGTAEEAIRYGWNYARLLAEGPSRGALVPEPGDAGDGRPARSPGSRS